MAEDRPDLEEALNKLKQKDPTFFNDLVKKHTKAPVKVERPKEPNVQGFLDALFSSMEKWINDGENPVRYDFELYEEVTALRKQYNV